MLYLILSKNNLVGHESSKLASVFMRRMLNGSPTVKEFLCFFLEFNLYTNLLIGKFSRVSESSASIRVKYVL